MPEEKVAMVYARHEEYGVTAAGRSQDLWFKIRREYPYGERLGGYTPGEPRDYPQLQAADLLAYELVHDFESIQKRPHLQMRWPLKQVLRMCKIPKPNVMFFDRLELLRIVRDNRDNELFSDQTGVDAIPEDQVLNADRKMAQWLIERGKYENEWPSSKC